MARRRKKEPTFDVREAHVAGAKVLPSVQLVYEASPRQSQVNRHVRAIARVIPGASIQVISARRRKRRRRSRY